MVSKLRKKEILDYYLQGNTATLGVQFRDVICDDNDVFVCVVGLLAAIPGTGKEENEIPSQIFNESTGFT